MTGVYLLTEKFCLRCGRVTPHETGWESEDPDVLDEECLGCRPARAGEEPSRSTTGGRPDEEGR